MLLPGRRQNDTPSFLNHFRTDIILSMWNLLEMFQVNVNPNEPFGHNFQEGKSQKTERLMLDLLQGIFTCFPDIVPVPPDVTHEPQLHFR